ncbi:MAG: histidine kinase [Cytophagales bacterium]|nr:histidine kinase [Cytophagales bacterium]
MSVLNSMSDTRPKYLFLWLFLFLSVALQAQPHNIQKGSLSVTVSVSMKGKLLSLDSLCEGFDPETNHPINLVIPEKSTFVLGMDSSMHLLTYQVNSQKPKYVNKPSEGAGFALSSSGGTSNTYTFIDETTADTLIVSWKVDYSNVEMIHLYPVEVFPNYVNYQFQNLFKDNVDSTLYDWSQENYITELDQKGVPVNPEFPYHQNDLFFVVENVTENATIQLKGFHETAQIFNEEEPFDLFIYEDLPDGKYEYVVRPYEGAPDEKSLIYPFTILKPWWYQEWALATLTVILVLIQSGIFFLVYRNKQRKREQQLLWQQKLSEAELKAIRAQLNPHFLFNALGSIQNLVVQQKNEVANSYLTKLSRLLRNVLSASENTFHELRSELGLIELYLELEQLRFPFEFELIIGEEVDQDTLTPVMLLQPFIENAIKHGVAGRDDSKVSLHIHVRDSKLEIEILDNGAGLSQPNGNSSGLQLSHGSIRPLSDLYGDEARITVANRKDASGVCVRITLPIG